MQVQRIVAAPVLSGGLPSGLLRLPGLSARSRPSVRRADWPLDVQGGLAEALRALSATPENWIWLWLK
jgi:hypothetical protein